MAGAHPHGASNGRSGAQIPVRPKVDKAGKVKGLEKGLGQDGGTGREREEEADERMGEDAEGSEGRITTADEDDGQSEWDLMAQEEGKTGPPVAPPGSDARKMLRAKDARQSAGSHLSCRRRLRWKSMRGPGVGIS